MAWSHIGLCVQHTDIAKCGCDRTKVCYEKIQAKIQSLTVESVLVLECYSACGEGAFRTIKIFTADVVVAIKHIGVTAPQ